MWVAAWTARGTLQRKKLCSERLDMTTEQEPTLLPIQQGLACLQLSTIAEPGQKTVMSDGQDRVLIAVAVAVDTQFEQKNGRGSPGTRLRANYTSSGPPVRCIQPWVTSNKCYPGRVRCISNASATHPRQVSLPCAPATTAENQTGTGNGKESWRRYRRHFYGSALLR